MKKLIKGLFIAVVFALFALSFVGCSRNTSNIAEGMVSREVTDAGWSEKQSNSAHWVFKKKLEITDLKMVEENGEVIAQTTVVSKINKTFYAEYKIKWYDTQGIEMDTMSQHWEPFILSGGETKEIKVTAPNNNVATFKIYIRRSNPATY